MTDMDDLEARVERIERFIELIVDHDRTEVAAWNIVRPGRATLFDFEKESDVLPPDFAGPTCEGMGVLDTEDPTTERGSVEDHGTTDGS